MLEDFGNLVKYQSRYYRLRSDRAAPHLADIPELARRLGVDELRLLVAALNTEKARLAMMRAEPVPAPKRKARAK